MKLPPGQSLTLKFPVVGEKLPPPEALDLDTWSLEIGGLASRELSLSYDQFIAHATDQLTADIHCVTSWSQLGMQFTGIRLSDFLERFNVLPAPSARFVRFQAWSNRNHDTSLPLESALADSWLIHSFDGRPLTPSRGYPLRVVTPSRYFYKSLKWLRRITFLESDHLGFWERTSGYHNNGDPWNEERLEGSRFASKKEADAFRGLSDFSKWQESRSDGTQRVIIKADLRNWRPLTTNLNGIQLKACDFGDACLENVDFSGANLTLGRFTGASLRNAQFLGTDLEGADFSGADLTGARFGHNHLSATTFLRADRPLTGWDGMTMIAPEGLLESQRKYLASLGIVSPLD